MSWSSRGVEGVVVLKIRIFALARELGLDSKVLLGLCDEAGVPLRNALATITPEERDKIVAYINGKDGGAKTEAPAGEPAPVREANLGKVREMRQMPSKPGKAEDVVEPEEETEEVVEAEESPAEEVSAEAETEVEADATEEVASEETETPADSEAAEEQMPVAEVSEAAEPEAAEEAPVVDDAAATTADSEPEPVAEEASEVPAEEEKPAAKVQSEAPVATPKPTGTSQKAASPMQRMSRPSRREMKPIGSVKDREATSESREKPKEKPKEREKAPDRPISRPLVAAPPAYQPPPVKPKPKKTAEKSMKPDVSIDQVIDRSSPLAEQMRQLKQARAEHDGTGTGRKKADSGDLIRQLRRQKEEQRQQKKLRRRKKSGPTELKTSAQIEFPITVRNLSEAIGRPAKSIMGYFFKAGKMVTINDSLEEEDALEVAMELGVDLEIKRSESLEERLLATLDHEDEEDTLVWRPPVITVLGHVDHGKTTLVDRLRSANVAAGEAGGITQHIAAYQIESNGSALTFVDTPGHAAFGEMRARGAGVTDVIVLVVAADDGVMPQTEECISHAKNAGVPIIVALNKMDLPEVDDQKTLQQLASHDLLPAEWGGEYEVVRTSGETGLGLDDLIETIQLTAELHDYTANPDREAVGVCLEAFRDEGLGVIAWLIVQKGTLKVGDNVLCGSSYGRIRNIYDDRGNELKEAPPSMPVKVTGLNEVPTSGVHFFAMKDIDEARQAAESRIHEGREEVLARRGKPKTIDDILTKARGGEGIQDLPLIIKADTPGSLEALRGELNKFEHPEVRIDVVHSAVGGVNESDVYLASAAGAIIVAFHVVAEGAAEQLAEKEGVEIRRYNIIYEVTEEIRQSLEGLLRPEKKEVTTGRAIVLQTFSISRFGTIAGCRVINGTIARDNRIHVIRDNTVLNDYRIGSLKREKDDAKEVREGMECGIRLDGFNDIKEGDLLEAFRIDEIQRTLD